MDIEKLIEKANHLGMELKRDGGEFEYSIGKKFLEYATAPSTLQIENQALRNAANGFKAENEKLRAELESLKKGHCAGCSVQVVETEALRDLNDAPKLRAELERMKEIMRYNGIMVIPSKYPGGRSEWNIPKPRG